MRRSLAILLFCLLLLPTFVEALNWERVARRLEQSIVRIGAQFPQGANFCTGWSINPQKGYFMTAYHCYSYGGLIASAIYVDGEPARLLWGSEQFDVAVFSANVRKPALSVARRQAAVGHDTASLGYGYGFAFPLFKSARISAFNVDLPNSPTEAKWILTDTPMIQGMSGAPIVNGSGEIVGIVQQSNGIVGWGRVIEPIYKATRLYWQ